MQARIETLEETKLVGTNLTMSFTNNRTAELWQNFMPRKKEVTSAVNNHLYSLQIYPPGYFDAFNATREFTKWAAVKVTDYNTLPVNMQAFTISKGLYAVFLYKGLSTEGAKAFQYIFSTWLPASNYELDNRPHFELLGEKYKNNDPGSEEEIWVPVKLRDGK